jgi:hypothetical protein
MLFASVRFVYTADRRASGIQDYTEYVGTFLEQAMNYKPQVIEHLKELLEAGKANNQVISR